MDEDEDLNMLTPSVLSCKEMLAGFDKNVRCFLYKAPSCTSLIAASPVVYISVLIPKGADLEVSVVTLLNVCSLTLSEERVNEYVWRSRVRCGSDRKRLVATELNFPPFQFYPNIIHGGTLLIYQWKQAC